jgi:malonate transporter and related proteins
MLTTVTTALVPVFFVMGLGYFAGRKKIVDNLHVNSLNALLMTFALPMSLFIAMAQTPASRLASGISLGFVMVTSMLVIFGITTFLNRRVFGKTIGETSVQSLNVSLPNLAGVGLPLLGSLFGSGSSASVSVALAAATVTLGPLTLVMLEGQTASAGGVSTLHRIVRAFLRAVRKPVVIGPVAGVAVALAGHPLPTLALQTFSLLGQATAGLALFVTGLVLSSKALNLNANVILGVLLKNVIHPLLVFGLAILLGFKAPEMHAAILLAAIPAGFFGVLFGLDYGVKSEDANSTLAISSLVSILTLAVAIFLTSGMK